MLIVLINCALSFLIAIPRASVMEVNAKDYIIITITIWPQRYAVALKKHGFKCSF